MQRVQYVYSCCHGCILHNYIKENDIKKLDQSISKLSCHKLDYFCVQVILAKRFLRIREKGFSEVSYELPGKTLYLIT